MGDEKSADDENNMDHTLDDRLNDLQGTEGGREEVRKSEEEERGGEVVPPVTKLMFLVDLSRSKLNTNTDTLFR
jgi:hypothetical protein